MTFIIWSEWDAAGSAGANDDNGSPAFGVPAVEIGVDVSGVEDGKGVDSRWAVGGMSADGVELISIDDDEERFGVPRCEREREAALVLMGVGVGVRSSALSSFRRPCSRSCSFSLALDERSSSSGLFHSTNAP